VAREANIALIYDPSWLAAATAADRPSALFNCFFRPTKSHRTRAFENEFRQCKFAVPRRHRPSSPEIRSSVENLETL